MSGSARQDPNVDPAFSEACDFVRIRSHILCGNSKLVSNPAFLNVETHALPCGFQTRALCVVIFNQFRDFGFEDILRGVNSTKGISKLLLF